MIARGVVVPPDQCFSVGRTLRDRLALEKERGHAVDAELCALAEELLDVGGEWLAARSVSGSPELPGVTDGRDLGMVDPMSTSEVAELLSVSRRQVTNLACRLGGRKLKSGWVFDRPTVLAYAARNEE